MRNFVRTSASEERASERRTWRRPRRDGRGEGQTAQAAHTGCRGRRTTLGAEASCSSRWACRTQGHCQNTTSCICSQFCSAAALHHSRLRISFDAWRTGCKLIWWSPAASTAKWPFLLPLPRRLCICLCVLVCLCVCQHDN